MIARWKLFNFKSIKNETKLDFGPLTIFAGANSSGKSAWLQSMLLISQTLAHRVGSRSVVLNGTLTKLGQFNDLKSQGSEAGQISIGFDCAVTDQPTVENSRSTLADALSRFSWVGSPKLETVSCELSFDADPSSPERELYQLQPRLFGCQLSVVSTAKREDKTEIRTSVVTVSRASGLADSRSKLDGLSEKEKATSWAEAALKFDVTLDPESTSELRELFSAQQVGCVLRHFLPDQLVVRLRPGKSGLLTGAQELIWRLWSKTETQGQPSPGTTDGENPEAPGEETLTAIQLPGSLQSAVTYLDRFFTRSVKYLGPLRDEPKALYPLATGVEPTDVGLRGEYTAAVLDLHKTQRIRYIPSDHFVSPQVETSSLLRSLDAAVTDWLRYLSVADSVVTVDKGKLGHELKIIPPGLKVPHDLTHVGVGVSQVLPILVMCLLAEPDTTLIFEQPELHLHPKVQTLLGDFFLSMSLLGKQCILETHSEYLINRLRFRAAAASTDDVSKAIRMYFVEKVGDSSTFRSVVVNEFGAIMDWPEGFFDQSQSEAEEILRAATRKRQSRGRRLPHAERHD